MYKITLNKKGFRQLIQQKNNPPEIFRMTTHPLQYSRHTNPIYPHIWEHLEHPHMYKF
jgi:hypothetical protein